MVGVTFEWAQAARGDLLWQLFKSHLNTYWAEPGEVPQLFEKLP
jgi:hypothetical protein